MCWSPTSWISRLSSAIPGHSRDKLFRLEDSVPSRLRATLLSLIMPQCGRTCFARNAGVEDVAGFEACIAQTGEIPAIERDTLAARRLGVRGTPTFLIEGLLIHGYPGRTILERYVNDALHSHSMDTPNPD